MRKGPDIFFGISLIALSVSVLLAIPSDTAASGPARMIVPVLGALTAGLFVLRRRAASRVGAGLLKPGSAAGLSKAELAAMTLSVVQTLNNAKAAPGGKRSAEYLVGLEISRLSAEWKAAHRNQPLTAAETRSLYLLAQYALAPMSDDDRKAVLKDVADPSLFDGLRRKVTDIQQGNRDSQHAFEDWKRAVGNTDMSHLLKDGWIAFLRSLDPPDPVLWHAVATDFHEIEAHGRLYAAFWILAQPDCDRATASDFIRGFVANELLETAVRQGDTPRLTAFQDVVRRYNAGFYVRFGLAPDADAIAPIAETIDGPFDGKAVAAMMNRIAQSAGIPPLVTPVRLLGADDKPTHPMPHRVRSPYDFWSDAGLHLRYPGPDWRDTPGTRA